MSDVGLCEDHVGVGGFPMGAKSGHCVYVYVQVIAQRSVRWVEPIPGLADVNDRSVPGCGSQGHLCRSIPCR